MGGLGLDVFVRRVYLLPLGIEMITTFREKEAVLYTLSM